MARHQKILIAVEPNAEANHVLELGKDYVDEATTYAVVTVVPPMQAYYGGPAGMSQISALGEHDREMAELTENHLRKMVAVVGLDSSKARVVRGHAADELCAIADDESFDLIVIGTHTRGRLRRLLGSTAAGVLHGAECDVMLVRVPG